MNQKESEDFKKMWVTFHDSVSSKPLTGSVLNLFFDQLQKFEFNEIRNALIFHNRESTFPPTTKSILDILKRHLPQPPSHISADEAWAIALLSMEESETVAYTDEIMQARAIAWEVYSEGDKVGARMAFRSAYERIIQTAPPPKWRVSLGYESTNHAVRVEDRKHPDAKKRHDAIKALVARGLIPESELKNWQIEDKTVSFAKLTHMAAEKTAEIEQAEREEIKFNLLEIKAMLGDQKAAKKLKDCEHTPGFVAEEPETQNLH